MVDRSDALEDCFAKTPFLEQNLPGGESVPHGYRFVVSRSGVFISHPHGDYDFARARTVGRDSRTSQGARAATPHSRSCCDRTAPPIGARSHYGKAFGVPLCTGALRGLEVRGRRRVRRERRHLPMTFGPSSSTSRSSRSRARLLRWRGGPMAPRVAWRLTSKSWSC